MKKLTLTTLFLIGTILAFGQEPKVSKMKKNTRNGKATYYVLQSDPTTYHGKYYVVAWTGNERIVDGNYSFGKKQGLWTERYYGVGNKSGPKSNGQYKDDLKTGTWTYFTMSGDTSQIYDYEKNELIFSNECGSEKKYKTKTGNGYVEIELDCPPIFVGGKDIFTSELSQTLSSYPSQLKELGLHTFEINTELIMTISDTGQILEIKFSRKIGYGYEESITKWIEKNGNNWIPGRINGQQVEVEMEFPIRQRFQF